MPNFTAFGASYVENEDEGKMALNIDSNVEESVYVATNDDEGKKALNVN